MQRLVAGGKRAALPLVARGQLRVEGDLGQLEEAGDRSGEVWGSVWAESCAISES